MYEWLIPVIAATSILTLIIIIVALLGALMVAIKIRNEYLKYCETLRALESVADISQKIACAASYCKDIGSSLVTPLQHMASSGCKVLTQVEKIAVNSLKKVADRIDCL